jgi:DMSO/TMAO reductase YedYZ molybdopterin-dependent catalytic subunit
MKHLKLWLLAMSTIIALASLPVSACRPAFTPPPGEVEAIEFQGTKLTPIERQGNNALKGTQIIDKDTYRLTIDGLVGKPLTLTYADLQAYAQESWLMDLNCVEGVEFYREMDWSCPKCYF